MNEIRALVLGFRVWGLGVKDLGSRLCRTSWNIDSNPAGGPAFKYNSKNFNSNEAS